MRIREPVVAGQFYASEPAICQASVEQLLREVEVDDRVPEVVRGGLVPHAGWICSGAVAVEVWRTLAARSSATTVVLFGAVHRHRGRQAAVFGGGAWETPLGRLTVDDRLAERILGHTNLILDDPYAHEHEHSLEVQMPLIKHLLPEAKVLPIIVPPTDTAHEVGEAAARTIQAYKYDALIVGTTDLTHYGPSYGFVPQGIGPEGNRWAKTDNDRRFLELVYALKAEEVVAEARRHQNACGGGAGGGDVGSRAGAGRCGRDAAQPSNQRGSAGRQDGCNPAGFGGLCGSGVCLMSERVAIGFDLGGTNAKAAVVGRDGAVRAFATTATHPRRGPASVVVELVFLADRVLEEAGLSRDAVVGAGLGSPGPMSVRTGTIIKAANLPGWEHVPLRKLLSEALCLPVQMDNDGNAAAYGEWWVGAGRDVGDMVMLTLGTGVGGGIVLGGEVLHGHFENAGELGHMIVQPGGLACSCGQRGCLERYASAAAVGRRAQSAIEAGESSSLAGRLSEGERVDCRAVEEAARAGDGLALRIWNEACELLAVACINLQHAFNPQRVVLGGGMAQAGAFSARPGAGSFRRATVAPASGLSGNPPGRAGVPGGRDRRCGLRLARPRADKSYRGGGVGVGQRRRPARANTTERGDEWWRSVSGQSAELVVQDRSALRHRHSFARPVRARRGAGGLDADTAGRQRDGLVAGRGRGDRAGLLWPAVSARTPA